MKNHHLQTSLTQAELKAPQYILTIQPPVFHASTIIFKDTQSLFNRSWKDDYDYSYGTHATPTTYNLADQITTLEKADFCLLAPSGLSAINLVNSTFLKSGDEVWLADNCYGPNLEHLQFLQQQYGIVVKVYNPTDVDSFQPSDKCKLLWLEATGSITLEFPDLKNLVKKAQQLNILTALDHTWGAGLAFSPFDFSDEHLAVDIAVHALTKYPSGGGDVLMGSVTTRSKDLYHQMYITHARQGIAVNGDDCALILRSLPSMALRYQQHHQSCLDIVQWLKQQPEVAQVLHPGLAECAGHQYWQEVCSTGLGAGIVSIIFKPEYDWQAIRRFCDGLKLFKLGYSWGGSTSLVMLYDMKHSRSLEQSHLNSSKLVRLCIGLEHSDDLIEDLAQALKQL